MFSCGIDSSHDSYPMRLNSSNPIQVNIIIVIDHQWDKWLGSACPLYSQHTQQSLINIQLHTNCTTNIHRVRHLLSHDVSIYTRVILILTPNCPLGWSHHRAGTPESHAKLLSCQICTWLSYGMGLGLDTCWSQQVSLPMFLGCFTSFWGRGSLLLWLWTQRCLTNFLTMCKNISFLLPLHPPPPVTRIPVDHNRPHAKWLVSSYIPAWLSCSAEWDQMPVDHSGSLSSTWLLTRHCWMLPDKPHTND